MTLSPPCHPPDTFPLAVYMVWIGFLKRNKSFDFFSLLIFSLEGMHRKETLDMFSYKWVVVFFLPQVFF